MSKNTNSKQNKTVKPEDNAKKNADITSTEEVDAVTSVENVGISETPEEKQSEYKPDYYAPTSPILKPGTRVTIKPETKITVTGSVLTPYAYDHVFIVEKILYDRIIVKCESLKFALTENDLNVIK